MTEPWVYAALGDSTGVGIGARDGRGYVIRLFERLVRERSELRLLNLCSSGATTRIVVSSQLGRAVSARPRFVTVFVGTNDLWWDAGEGAEANVERIAKALVEVPHVVFGTLPNVSHAPAAAMLSKAQRELIESRTRHFNAHLAGVARAQGHLVVDLFGVGLADRPHFFSEDGFHPSAEGYEALAARLFDSLAPLVRESR